MRKIHILPVLLLLVPLLAGCERDKDFTPPSFLHVEAIKVVPAQQNPITTDAGFYTSDIVAAVVYVRRKESLHLDTLGHFRLPLTIPILYSGDVEYIDIYPAVKQSGSATLLPVYPFYNRIRLSDTTIRSGDTLWMDTITTTYNVAREDVPVKEMFEPEEGSLIFDSVMQWREIRQPDYDGNACSGRGYGYIPVNDSTYYTTTVLNQDLAVVNPQTHRIDPTRNVYLEMDVRSDVEMEVIMNGAYIEGSTEQDVQVMRVYECGEWTHLYVNLWRAWKELNYCSTFKLKFMAVNESLKNGEIWIDNLRVVTGN